MTSEEIAAFYREIGAVCEKHNMGCLVGIWFSGAGNEEHGIIKCVDLLDTDMVMLGNVLAFKMDDWKQSVYAAPKTGQSIREVISGSDETN